MTILAHVSTQTDFKVSSRREEADMLFQTNGFQDMPAVRSISTFKDDVCLLGIGMVIAGVLEIGAAGNATY